MQEIAMTENRMGAFDNLRLVLAIVVTVAHLNELQGIESRIFPSLAAVSAFFCLAGFFCFRSYRSCVKNGGGLRSYAIKRFFRIYPAYATVVVVPAAVWALMRGPSSEEARYLIANLATLNFLHPCIGSLFSGQRYCTVNGSLWTIKNELVLYGSIPIFFWLLTSTTARARILAASAIFVGASTYFYVTNHGGYTTLAKQFPSGLAYFPSSAAVDRGLNPCIARRDHRNLDSGLHSPGPHDAARRRAAVCRVGSCAPWTISYASTAEARPLVHTLPVSLPSHPILSEPVSRPQCV
jgi:peptidoglycan/LPS O-acetylase OafA/YrhL